MCRAGPCSHSKRACRVRGANWPSHGAPRPNWLGGDIPDLPRYSSRATQVSIGKRTTILGVSPVARSPLFFGGHKLTPFPVVRRRGLANKAHAWPVVLLRPPQRTPSMRSNSGAPGSLSVTTVLLRCRFRSRNGFNETARVQVGWVVHHVSGEPFLNDIAVMHYVNAVNDLTNDRQVMRARPVCKLIFDAAGSVCANVSGIGALLPAQMELRASRSSQKSRRRSATF